MKAYKCVFKYLFLMFIAVFLLSSCSSGHYLKIKGQKLYIEISLTYNEKVKGLSERDKLEKNHGMLFVYEREQVLHYWMKNTYIPLSIAFIRENGVVIGIYDMKPESLTVISSIYPCKYALEVNKGWFKEVGLEVGDYIGIPSYETLIKWHDEQTKGKK